MAASADGKAKVAAKTPAKASAKTPVKAPAKAPTKAPAKKAAAARSKKAESASPAESDMSASAAHAPAHTPAKSRDERIREAAYRIFESRRHEGGDETDDWLRAEAEVDALERATPGAP